MPKKSALQEYKSKAKIQTYVLKLKWSKSVRVLFWDKSFILEVKLDVVSTRLDTSFAAVSFALLPVFYALFASTMSGHPLLSAPSVAAEWQEFEFRWAAVSQRVDCLVLNRSTRQIIDSIFLHSPADMNFTENIILFANCEEVRFRDSKEFGYVLFC